MVIEIEIEMVIGIGIEVEIEMVIGIGIGIDFVVCPRLAALVVVKRRQTALVVEIGMKIEIALMIWGMHGMKFWITLGMKNAMKILTNGVTMESVVVQVIMNEAMVVMNQALQGRV